MLHFDKSGELKRRFLLTAVQRNKSSQLRIRALQEIAQAKDAEAFDLAIDEIGTWSRDERREATKVCLQALAEKRIGRRDQANAWIWRLAEYTREVHEEYAVQRWPETKRLLGLLVNSSGGAHARNARRLVHATRKQDRRLSAALLAAALAHTPEAEEVLRGARTRMARKPNSLARDLLRNFPKKRSRGSRRKKRTGEEAAVEGVEVLETTDVELVDDDAGDDVEGAVEETPQLDEEAAVESIGAAAALLPSRAPAALDPDGEAFDDAQPAEEADVPAPKPKRTRTRTRKKAEPVPAPEPEAAAEEPAEEPKPKPKRTRRTKAQIAAEAAEAETNVVTKAEVVAEEAPAEEAKPKPKRTRRTKAQIAAEAAAAAEAVAEEAPAEEPKPKRTRTTRKKAEPEAQLELDVPAGEEPPAEKPKRTRRATAKKPADDDSSAEAA
jgi:hypothetical protein